jgi:hypothetical protein
MVISYKENPTFIHGFNYLLSGLIRDLDELKKQNLLLGDVADVVRT